jgi:hypothetical protein
MILYIAGNLQVEMLELISRKIIVGTNSGFVGAENFLCSFADRSAQETARHFCVQPQRRIFIDSGAYSAWKNAKKERHGKKRDGHGKINLSDYIAFCKEVDGIARCPVVYAALDIIPQNLTDSEIQRACDEGWDNYQTMKQEGISPCLMTYHQFEHKRQLTRIMDDSDYFAVSPRKRDVSTETKLKWLRQVFRECGYLEGMDKPRINKKIHGLGVSSVDWMEQFPFFSVDNTAWLPASKAHLRRQPTRLTKHWSLDDWFRVMRVEESIAPDLMKEDIRRGLGYASPGDKPDPDANTGVYFLVTLAMWRDVETQHRVTELWRSKGVDWDVQKDIASPWKPKPWWKLVDPDH